MSDKIAIRAENISKDFMLPNEKAGTLKSIFTGIFSGKPRGHMAQHALKNISFQVKEGEFFGIVGRNGSGKSTLLKILANIYQPDKGYVQVTGRVVPFIELGVGFNPELTGRDNVFLNGALLGFSRKEMEAMYGDIVEFAELEKFMDQKLKNYSSGMQVRLAFSLAIRANADILLIDEVLAVGDASFQRKCFEYFKNLKKHKKTVVFVSHDMNAIREYCDRAMLVDHSEVIEVGDTSKIAEKYIQLFTNDNLVALRYQDKEDNRWGDGGMTFDSIEVKPGSSSITIVQKFKAHRNIESAVVGFRIRDGAGREVTGSNTKKEERPVKDLIKGATVTIKWKMPNILSEGEYSLDPSLLYDDEITVADWWNDAARFTINKGRHLPYSIDPGFEVTIKNKA